MSEKIPTLNLDDSPTHYYQDASVMKTPVSNKKTHKQKKQHNALSNDVYKGKIYTKRVKGFYQKLRRKIGFLLLLAYLVIPWFDIGDRPAVLFDLQQQKFHILWMSFWPQDAVFLVWLLVLAAFLLFAVTVVIGRAWCGFTCPQTIWTFLFIWAEDKCEGDRNQRIKLDQQPWHTKKILKKGAKHSIWVAISLVTAITFVGYFYGIKALTNDLLNMDAHYLAYFWILFFVLGTYLNAGWLREKVCLHMCPYSRFQSVMYDKDTLLITYDAARGENRGKRKAEDNAAAKGLGDCVDCSLCVQVCPVDIDIRDGLQYACIDCGLCADACDNVMEKMGYAKGLIRLTSENALANLSTSKWSPRLIGYSLASVIVIAAFGYSLMAREALSIDVIRDRSGQLYTQMDDGIENVYTVKINNKAAATDKFELRVIGELPFQIRSNQSVYVKKGEVDTLTVRVWLPEDTSLKGKSDIEFVVVSKSGDTETATQASSFIAPY